MGRTYQGYTSTTFEDKKAGKHYAKLIIDLGNGKTETRSRQATGKRHAETLRAELVREYLLERDSRTVEGMTMRVLIEKFKAAEVTPAVYLGERKVGGYKHPKKVESYLTILETYWGDKIVRSITPQDVMEFKRYLIALPKERGGGERSVHNVNGINRHLRIVLNYARRNQWIDRNPCSDVKGFIDASNEMPRKRAEDDGEVERLIAQCIPPRDHLRPWIVIAIETALRPGEISKLTRGDIDFERKVIVARATNTKTNRRREVPMTEILEAELRLWFQTIDRDREWSQRVPNVPTANIFGGYKSNKTAFATACRDANIQNLQRKDLRKWGVTRLATALRAAGIPDIHGMAITGHTVLKTYTDYVITDQTVVDTARLALDALREAKAKAKEEKEKAKKKSKGKGKKSAPKSDQKA